jgi:hypothetical protein
MKKTSVWHLIIEAWKSMKRECKNKLKCSLCGHNFIGSLTRAIDYLLSISNNKRGGVEGCTNLSSETKVILEKSMKLLKSRRKIKKQKQQIQAEIARPRTSTPIPSFTSNIAASPSHPAKSSNTGMLNSH